MHVPVVEYRMYARPRRANNSGSPFMRHAFLRFASFALLSVFALAAHADPKAEIVAAYQKMVEKGRFQSITESTSGKTVSRTEGTVVWPNRFHMKTDSGGTRTEFIVIPDGTWMNNGGTWTKLPMSMDAMIQSLTPEAMRKGIDGMSNVVYVGEQDLDGSPARVYTYDSKVTIMGVTAESKVRLWVDAASGLIARQDGDGKAMGMSSTSTTRYRYGDFEVNAPK
jgi:outer membrane lipoprotein-sorting protein